MKLFLRFLFVISIVATSFLLANSQTPHREAPTVPMLKDMYVDCQLNSTADRRYIADLEARVAALEHDIQSVKTEKKK